MFLARSSLQTMFSLLLSFFPLDFSDALAVLSCISAIKTFPLTVPWGGHVVSPHTSDDILL